MSALELPVPALQWIVDLPSRDTAGLEHALSPGADYTLCARSVAYRLEGSAKHPHRGQLTLCPRWPAERRCRQCTRMAAVRFTLVARHLFDGTRELPLCGRPVPDWPSPRVCGTCRRSLAYVTRWRGLEAVALELLVEVLEGRAA